MIFFQELNNIMTGLAIAPWEIASYFSLASVYMFMGLHQSLLIGTYVFTYYRGFKNLLRIQMGSGDNTDGLVVLYLICGLLVLVVAVLRYFAKQLRRAFIHPPA